MKFKSKYITSFILAAIICTATFCGCENNTAPISTAPVSSEATAISSESSAVSSEVPAIRPAASSESAASSEQPESSSEMPAASSETPAASQAQEIEPEKEISEPQNEPQEPQSKAADEPKADEKSAEPAADNAAKTANEQPAVSEQAAETPAEGQSSNTATPNSTISDEENPWRESLGTYEEDVAAGNYTGYISWTQGDFDGNKYHGHGPDDPAPTPTYDETLKAAIDYYGGYENIPDDMKQVMGIK